MPRRSRWRGATVGSIALRDCAPQALFPATRFDVMYRAGFGARSAIGAGQVGHAVGLVTVRGMIATATSAKCDVCPTSRQKPAASARSADEFERVPDQLIARLPMVRMLQVPADENTARIEQTAVAWQWTHAHIDPDEIAVLIEVERDRIDFVACTVTQREQQQIDSATAGRQRRAAGNEALPLRGRDQRESVRRDPLEHDRLKWSHRATAGLGCGDSNWIFVQYQGRRWGREKILEKLAPRSRD